MGREGCALLFLLGGWGGGGGDVEERGQVGGVFFCFSRVEGVVEMVRGILFPGGVGEGG
jgi:hypothetical protein